VDGTGGRSGGAGAGRGLSLLNDVRQFVGKKMIAAARSGLELAAIEIDVGLMREGERAGLVRQLAGFLPGMDAHARKISMAESGFHFRTRLFRQRFSTTFGALQALGESTFATRGTARLVWS
jgi:hypothetical protein